MAKRLDDLLTEAFETTSLDTLLGEEIPEDRWIVDELLSEGGFSVLVAAPKTGKTTLATLLSIRVADGKSFLGRETVQGTVLYFALEEIRQEAIRRYRKMGVRPGLPIHLHVGKAPENALESLENEIRATGAALCIVDTLFKLIPGRGMNSYASTSTLLAQVSDIARRTGCHILATHHTTKAPSKSGTASVARSIMGSQAIFAGVDTLLVMARDEENDVISLQTIQRYGESLPETSLGFDPETCDMQLLDRMGRDQADKLGEKVLETIALLTVKKVGPTEPEIRVRIGGNQRHTALALQRLLQQHRITRYDLGVRGKPFRYTIAAPSELRLAAEQD